MYYTLAQTMQSAQAQSAEYAGVGVAVMKMLIFAITGILLMALGFKVFDWMMPKVDFQKELAEKHNLAVAIVIASVILGVAAIVTVAMV